MTHLESLAITDSQALKHSEIEGFVKKWRYAKYPLYLALYLDIFAPLKVLSLHMQQEIHDPVNFLQPVKDFSWTMVKIRKLIENSIDEPGLMKSNYSKFLGELNENEDGKKAYQQTVLKDFMASKGALEKNFPEIIQTLSNSVDQRFKEIRDSPIYSNLIEILNVLVWPSSDESLIPYGDVMKAY